MEEKGSTMVAGGVMMALLFGSGGLIALYAIPVAAKQPMAWAAFVYTGLCLLGIVYEKVRGRIPEHIAICYLLGTALFSAGVCLLAGGLRRGSFAAPHSDGDISNLAGLTIALVLTAVGGWLAFVLLARAEPGAETDAPPPKSTPRT